MRVIAGEFRSRKLKTVSGMAVRPTPDRVREALFNVLTPRLQGKIFLDAFAGSGAVGIEAVSRGAAKAILIEKSAAALAVIQENVASLGLRKEVAIVRGNASTAIPRLACDVAFVDPPYDRPKDYDEAMAALDGIECPLVIAQHESRVAMAESYGGLSKTRVLRHGSNSLSFFERR